MSANRLFRMVCLLLENGHMTAVQLGEKLGVSVRTVYRDVDALSAAGVPICTTQGKGGGVSLMEGCVLDRASFTPEEQRQLLLALSTLPEGEGSSVLARVSALFRREEDDWLQVNLSRWGSTRWDSETFRALRDAILRRCVICFRYAGSRGEVRLRRVLPARLVFKGQAWYLQAWCTEREEFRTFRLSRMLELTVTDQQFHRRLDPPDIDFSGDIPPMFRLDCRLRFSPALAWRVPDAFSRDSITELPDGSLEVSAVFPDEGWLTGYLLSFGTGLEVLEPPSLRRRLAEAARELAVLHSRS